MNEKVLQPKTQNDKLNSKVGNTFTYKQLLEVLSKRPNKIKAIIS